MRPRSYASSSVIIKEHVSLSTCQRFDLVQNTSTQNYTISEIMSRMGASLSNMFLLKSNLQTLLLNHCRRHSSLSFVLLSLAGNHLTSAEGVWDLLCLRHHIYLLGLADVNLLSIFYGSLLLLPSSSFLPECELS
jgi:hypothetical protein